VTLDELLAESIHQLHLPKTKESPTHDRRDTICQDEDAFALSTVRAAASSIENALYDALTAARSRAPRWMSLRKNLLQTGNCSSSIT